MGMRGQRFDDFSKALARSNSRRGMFKVMLAGVLGLTAGAVVRPESGAAQTLPTPEPCQPNAQASPPCVTWCAQNFPLSGPGSIIVNGHLTVGATCAQLAACGQGPCFECGPAAPAGHPQLCATPSGNVCCSAGTPCCTSGTCVALSTTTNCGACGHTCPAAPANGTEVRVNGTCTFTCASGYGNCGGGVCTPLNTSSNCGTCGNACGSDQNCSAGTCCPSGMTACNGTCTNTQTDVSNCGSCGNVCTYRRFTPGGVCINGSCTCLPPGSPVPDCNFDGDVMCCNLGAYCVNPRCI
jgi:hypothetical protein